VTSEQQGALELRRRLLAVAPEARAELLLSSPDPRAAVRTVPAQELYLTILSSADDEAQAILRFAARPQLEFVFDIDGWLDDRLDAGRSAQWLLRLCEAGPELVARFCAEADESLVVLLLSTLLHVYKLDESVDPRFAPPDRPLMTLDRTYFFELREGVPDELADAFSQALSLLRARSVNSYQSLLEQVMWSIPSEVSETAFQARNSRLAEKGFPPLEESLAVWSSGNTPLREQRTRLMARIEAAAPRSDLPASSSSPRLDSTLTSLTHAMQLLPAEQREGWLHELVRTANRFAVASREHLGAPETHHRAFQTACAHLELGVAQLAGHDLQRRGVALSQISVRELVRLGTGAVLTRSHLARQLRQGWIAHAPLGIERLDQPWVELLNGLCAPRPYYSLDGANRPFQRFADLERVDAQLTELEQLGRFLGSTLQLAAGTDLPELDPLPAGRSDAADLEWSAVLVTAVLRRMLDQPARPVPFSASELAGAIAHSSLDRIELICGQLTVPALSGLVRDRIEELRSTIGVSPIDPRFARGVLMHG
jgi:hypothetical protein